MTKKKKEPRVLRSVGFPLSVWQAANILTEKERGSVNDHVILAFKEYLIKKGYLAN